MTIQLLPPEVITAIAAGEVIERPADVVKELVENALDAGATQVTIELEGAGLELIRISDDGCGIPQKELALSLQRHTTSKISSLADFAEIASLGFRGEALASIASVADLTIFSRTQDQELGFKLDHSSPEPTPLALPVGTTLVVRHLFERHPVRKKFLKAEATELRASLEVVTHLAVHYPQVGFSFSHHQRRLLQVPAHQTSFERLTSLFGTKITSHLKPVKFESPELALQGWIGSPQIAALHRKQQYFAVNGRPVKLGSLSRTVKQAYASLLTPRHEPWLLFELQIPAQRLDANTHPRKVTVRIIHDQKAWSEIQMWLETVLSQTPEVVYPRVGPAEGWALADPGQKNWSAQSRQGSPVTADVLTQELLPWKFDSLDQIEILQIDRTYLAYQTPDGLLLFDQHAVHERILFDQYLKQLQTTSDQHTATSLTPPVLLRLAPAESLLLESLLPELHQLGFAIEPFGSNTFRITQVPVQLQGHSLETVIGDMLHDFEIGQPLHGIDRQAERTAAYLSCRHAVKAGDFLTPDQRRELIQKLWETPRAATCPHGRPTHILINTTDLAKMFKRR